MEFDSSSRNAQKGPKACATCAKAKARCIPGPNPGGICQRCYRLGKPCPSQIPAPPRKRKENHRPTRVAELERRIEDLTTKIEERSVGRKKQLPLPTAQRQTYPLTPDDDHNAGSSSQSPSQYGLQALPGQSGAQVGSAAAIFDRLTSTSVPSPHNDSISSQTSPEIILSSEHAQQNHTAGDGENMSDWDAQWQPLPAMRPVNASNILTGASRPSEPGFDVQSEGGRAKRRVSAAVAPQWPRPEDTEVTLNEYRTLMQPLFPYVIVPPKVTAVQLAAKRPLLWKSVILQGLHTDCERQVPLGNTLLEEIIVKAFLKPQRSMDMLQGLEVYLAWLHFNLTSYQLTNALFLIRSMAVTLNLHDSPDASQSPTQSSLEHMRALAGVFYLVNMLFTTNKKPDVFLTSSYLDTCCNVLEERNEYPTDALAVAHVRIQQLAQYVALSLKAHGASDNASTNMPFSLLADTLRSRINEARDRLPPGLRNEETLLGQLKVIEVVLGEASLNDKLCEGLQPAERVALLWSCLDSVKTYMHQRLGEPMGARPRWNCLSSFDIAYVMLVSLKLITLSNVPGWDMKAAQATLNPIWYFDALCMGLRAIARMRRGGTDVLPPPVPKEQWTVVDPFQKMVENIEYMTKAIKIDLAQIALSSSEQGAGKARDNLTAMMASTTVTEASKGEEEMVRLPPEAPFNATPDIELDMGAFYNIPPEALFAGQDLLMTDFDGALWPNTDGLDAMGSIGGQETAWDTRGVGWFQSDVSVPTFN